MLKSIARKKVKGQSLAEYGLILGLVSIIAIAALQTMGGEISNIMNNINTALSGAGVTSGTTPTPVTGG